MEVEINRYARGVENILTFCIAQKATKSLVPQKTRLINRAFVWHPGLLSRLSLFHSYHFPALWPESGHQGSSNSFGAQVYYLFEMIFYEGRCG